MFEARTGERTKFQEQSQELRRKIAESDEIRREWIEARWKQQQKLAKELCQRNGYCGRIYQEKICVKAERHEDDCKFSTTINRVIPF